MKFTPDPPLNQTPERRGASRSGKANKKARDNLTKFLSQHLSGFGEEFHEQFLCPTCMTTSCIKNNTVSYTAGHIIPESAGGKDWTILCKTCNSLFGKLQDKWFGEYLSVLKNPAGMLIHAKSKSKYITINGVTVSGIINTSKIDGAIEILLPTNFNPPGKIESIPYGDTLEVQFAPELTKHINEIQVGYITAAYLTWFKKIGYNWAMQSSLNLVRKQIQECDYTPDGAKVVDLEGDELHEPHIGIILESGYAYPCCLMYDRVVIFPTPSSNNAPSAKSISFSANFDIHFLDLEIMNVPYSVSLEGSIAILPDMLRKNPTTPEHALHIYANPNRKAQWLPCKK